MSVTLDPARSLPIYFRIARYGVLTFTFVDANGLDFDISAYDFRFVIYYKENSEKVLYEPSDVTGSPVTNTLSYEFTIAETQNIKQGRYYWQLIVDGNETWLNGAAYAHKDEFDGVDCEPHTIVVETGDVIVNVTVTAGGGSSIDGLPMSYQGDWEGSTNAAPTTSASGGTIKGGMMWNVNSSTTTLLGSDGGIIPKGMMLMALVSSPGADTTDDTKWKIIAGVN